MNILQKFGKIFLALLFLLLLLTPVFVLYMISSHEQMQYQQASDIELKDFAYGDICTVFRKDVEEEISVSGHVISTAMTFVELNQYRDPYSIRFIIESGQKVNAGEIIGYYKGEPVLSDQAGVVKSISLGSDSYVMLESLENLALAIECSDERLLDRFAEGEVQLKSEDGMIFTVAEIDDVKNENGNAVILLSCENRSLTYGKRYSDLRLKTNRVFPQSLVVEKKCVYTLSGDDKHYIRRVDANGEFVEEVEVTLGYTDGDYVCVSGVTEGVYCDGGYKAVVEGGSQ